MKNKCKKTKNKKRTKMKQNQNNDRYDITQRKKKNFKDR